MDVFIAIGERDTTFILGVYTRLTKAIDAAMEDMALVIKDADVLHQLWMDLSTTNNARTVGNLSWHIEHAVVDHDR